VYAAMGCDSRLGFDCNAMQLDAAKLRAVTDRYPYSGQGVSPAWLADWTASFAHYYHAAGEPASPQEESSPAKR
jgi:hypothetical protein